MTKSNSEFITRLTIIISHVISHNNKNFKSVPGSQVMVAHRLVILIPFKTNCLNVIDIVFFSVVVNVRLDNFINL